MPNILKSIASEIEILPEITIKGKVSAVKGLAIEVEGIEQFASVGSKCEIISRSGGVIRSEVIGFNGGKTILTAFEELHGVGGGCDVILSSLDQAIHPSDSLLGRVVNCFGEPIDGKGPIIRGKQPYFLKSAPPPANQRKRVAGKLDMGVRGVNAFITCCLGQRLGIFAGSGVGKSVLLAMFTKFAKADVKVIGLIGERGREVQEFVQDYLGEEGLKNAVIVVATSDESALARRQAAYLMMTISEYFRDQNKEVLAMMDSVTRFAMAQREIGLAAGEPPTTKGYTPSVFSELPKLLERSGPGVDGQGSITGLFTVLVEGDDHNEPVSDSVRSILDGHIVLARSIAARGRYPAIDVLNSISRTMPNCNNEYENKVVMKARSIMATYEEMADMVRIGAYKQGSDQEVDEAIRLRPALERFLSQLPGEHDGLNGIYEKLAVVIEYKS